MKLKRNMKVGICIHKKLGVAGTFCKDPDPDPDPESDLEMDLCQSVTRIQIRIRIEMVWIRNTGLQHVKQRDTGRW